MLPVVYSASEAYNTYYSGKYAHTFDDIYWDIWRWFPRYEDGSADWNRDGVSLRDRPGNYYANYNYSDPILA